MTARMCGSSSVMAAAGKAKAGLPDCVLNAAYQRNCTHSRNGPGHSLPNSLLTVHQTLGGDGNEGDGGGGGEGGGFGGEGGGGGAGGASDEAPLHPWRGDLEISRSGASFSSDAQAQMMMARISVNAAVTTLGRGNRTAGLTDGCVLICIPGPHPRPLPNST